MELNPSNYRDSEDEPALQATPAQSSSVTTNGNEGSTSDEQKIFQNLSSYPFDQDREYQLGLAAILGHPDSPATQDEILQNADLVLQAKCFYFARRFSTPPIDAVSYKHWLTSTSLTSNGPSGISHASQMQLHYPMGSQDEQSIVTNSAPASVSTSDEQPPYPTSFAHIVDLITQNKPIPGIEEIPTTVLEPGSSKQDHASRRRKPWETSEENVQTNVLQTEEIAPAFRQIPQQQNTDVGSSTGTGGNADGGARRQTGPGVVRILQPNAIADTGLIARD